MELRQLKYFLSVAEELHFGRAASKLHMSQPPLTVAIRKLERELGVDLFQRSTRRVCLTPAGELFRDRVESVLGQLDDAVGDLAEVRGGRLGRLKVGFVSSASYTLIPQAVQRFRVSRPRVDLQLLPSPSGEQINQLMSGELDLGVLRDPVRAPGVAMELLVAEELVAVIPSEHPLAGESVIRPDALAGASLVLFPYHLMPGYVARVLSLFDGLRVPPVVAQEAVHQETVVGLVAGGVGVSILPASVSHFSVPGVVVRPIDTSLRSELHVACTPESAESTAEFRRCLGLV